MAISSLSAAASMLLSAGTTAHGSDLLPNVSYFMADNPPAWFSCSSWFVQSPGNQVKEEVASWQRRCHRSSGAICCWSWSEGRVLTHTLQTPLFQFHGTQCCSPPASAKKALRACCRCQDPKNRQPRTPQPVLSRVLPTARFPCFALKFPSLLPSVANHQMVGVCMCVRGGGGALALCIKDRTSEGKAGRKSLSGSGRRQE